jgi:hypothetical protein
MLTSLVLAAFVAATVYLSEEQEHERCFAASGNCCSRVLLEGKANEASYITLN